jgi:hypothetical protein
MYGRCGSLGANHDPAPSQRAGAEARHGPAPDVSLKTRAEWLTKVDPTRQLRATLA